MITKFGTDLFTVEIIKEGYPSEVLKIKENDSDEIIVYKSEFGQLLELLNYVNEQIK
jgi:hypothetical protein